MHCKHGQSAVIPAAAGFYRCFYSYLLVSFQTGFSRAYLAIISRGPLPLTDPFKTLLQMFRNCLTHGIWMLWSNRLKLEKRGKASRTFYDWFFIWEITAVGVTGLVAELLRWAIQTFGYIVYFMHLVFIVMLFFTGAELAH